MRITVTVIVIVIVTVGVAAVVFLGARAFAAQEPWWRLLASVLPLSLVAGAVLALVGSPA